MVVQSLVHAAIVLADATPAPTDPTSGGGSSIGDIIPYVTGAGGALVVLLLVLWMFLTDKITTVSAVGRLREADNNRFNDMVAQRDALVKSLEGANSSLAVANNNAAQSLELLTELVPRQRGGGSGRGARA